MLVSDLLQAARQQERDEFAAAFPCPFLVCDDALLTPSSTGRTDSGSASPAAFDDGATVHSDTALPALAPQLMAFPVRKEQTLYPSMITIGRTTNHDVAIIDGRISKFHAFFRVVDEHYELFDAGSRNGTFVGDKRLVAKGAGMEVRLGDTISLAGLGFKLVDAAEAWKTLRRAARLRPAAQ